ncbi:hypothetical protein [Amycolatopsis sp. WGS_07]|uniref:hypothetical protein n=1 Tax=Amycolatopsis sp. WGS_07 TaxID=3076764 RepID=UPI00387306A3
MAGVAGGVGTSTWVRILALARAPATDLGVYRGGPVEVLVTDTSARAAARIGPALARCPHKPLLVVMHRDPADVAVSRAFLRQALPHIAGGFEVGHRREWLQAVEVPARLVFKDKPLGGVLNQFWRALADMYRPPAADPRSAGAAQAAQRIAPVPQRVPAGARAGPAAWQPVSTHNGRVGQPLPRGR